MSPTLGIVDLGRRPYAPVLELQRALCRARGEGRLAEDLLLLVPEGTLVRDAARGHLLKDLVADGDEVRVAKGGRGGRGNAAFASATRQVPRIREEGRPGEERELALELRVAADAGLVGLPNAGKSTFLSRVSAARPKAADGGFTVVLARSGASFRVREGKTIIDTLIDNGIDAAYSCLEGVCGTCETRVLEGVPDHRDLVLSKQERAANRTMMICCSGSKTDKLVLDL